MPELPEVETMARELNARLKGRVISKVLLIYEPIVAGDPNDFIDLITGRQILSVFRFGKWIRFDLDGQVGLLIHLKMTGQFSIGSWPVSFDGPWPAHARAAFNIQPAEKNGQEAFFYHDIRKFGRLRAFKREALEDFLKKLSLGPDPLTISAECFEALLKTKKGRLKSVLLDQVIISGLGNIYVDESLFAASLSPLRPANSLNGGQSAHLLTQVKDILTKAIEFRGSTVENYKGLEGGGDYQKFHQVYGKKGHPCPRCGSLLECATVGGRTTVYCPICQD
jgi:formamidopyrimidine-DNA glycosylase